MTLEQPFPKDPRALRLRDGLQVEKYMQEKRRFYHSQLGIHIVKIFAGDCYVSGRDDEMMATILGSCISACVRQWKSVMESSSLVSWLHDFLIANCYFS